MTNFVISPIIVAMGLEALRERCILARLFPVPTTYPKQLMLPLGEE
jgi:hypothetical protein